MSIAEHPPQVAAPPGSLDGGQRFLIHNVSWEMYDRMCQIFEDHPLRMNYDGEELELITPSRRHKMYGYHLGRFIEVMAEELQVLIEPGGSTTLRHLDAERGLEPDNSFWTVHEEQMRGKMDLDLTVDPPPDLFIEIEVSRSLFDRLGICAALKVPEVWRFDGKTIYVLRLRDDGTYEECEHSPTFPGIPLDGLAGQLAKFLQPGSGRDYLSRLREFRQWVREQIGERGA